MNSLGITRRIGWLALSLLTLSLAVTPGIAGDPPRENRSAPSTTDVSGAPTAQTVASRLAANNFSLAKAVSAAEQHCKGVAIAANGRCTGEQANADAVVDVTVLDATRNVQVVTIGMDGRVISMTAACAGRALPGAGSSASSQIVRADQVIGRAVVSPSGEDLGKIEDLAIDPTSGRVGYAVLSFGGWLGINDKLFAIPWPKLQPHGANKYALDVSKEQLKSAPGFTKSTWPDMSDIKWNETIHTYYQQPYYWSNDDYDPTRTDTPRRPSIYKGSDVIGMNVINNQKDSIGEIEDLVVDPQSGRIRYAVLSVGGFLGIKERYIAVPWSAFRYDGEARKLVLDVDKQRIEQAPGFDKKNWPMFGDEAWATDLHKYYNVKPYWHDDSP